MSYLAMLGATKYMEEKMKNACDAEGRKEARMWLRGYFTCLQDDGKLMEDELYLLMHSLDNELWR